MKQPSSQRAAFSLVEVTLALGVAGFCLLAIFGLLPVGLNSNAAAINQTIANGVLSSIVTDLRATPVAVPVGSAAVISPQFSVSIPANPGGGIATPLYFSSEGQLTTASSARYKVTVSFLANSGAKSATLVLLKAAWPAAAAAPASTVEMFTALDRN